MLNSLVSLISWNMYKQVFDQKKRKEVTVDPDFICQKHTQKNVYLFTTMAYSYCFFFKGRSLQLVLYIEIFYPDVLVKTYS